MTELNTDEILEVMQRTKREFYLSIFDIIQGLMVVIEFMRNK